MVFGKSFWRVLNKVQSPGLPPPPQPPAVAALALPLACPHALRPWPRPDHMPEPENEETGEHFDSPVG